MSRPFIDENGEVNPKSVDLLSRDELELWIRRRLHREDWLVPGGAPESQMPHYLFAVLYPKLARPTREDFQNILIKFLRDLASNPISDWLGQPGHELIMLADPVLVQSPRREDAIDLLLSVANSEHLKSGDWPNLHFRALQGLIVLGHRAGIDFWRRQISSQDSRFAPVILEGLALFDVDPPFSWLTEIDWDDAIEDGIVGLLPSLLESYGTAKVAASIENALLRLPPRGYATLLAFCEQEGITISLLSRESKTGDSDVDSQGRLGGAERGVIPRPVTEPLASFSSEKLVLLANQLKKGRTVQSKTVIPPRPRFNYFPLSFSQMRFWFLDQLQPGSPLYTIRGAVRLNGKLNLRTLRRCFNTIVRRHEALRTIFQDVDSEPVQVIVPAIALPIQMLDLRELPQNERETQMNRLALEELQRPFDLSRGPLLRLTLMRLDEEEHVLLIVMHHIISDDWSINILIRELVILYKAFVARKTSPLPELSIQYADFATWQREWMSGEVLESQLAYWRQQLSGAPTMLELPTEKPRPAVQTFRGQEYQEMLPRELMENLQLLNRQEGVTLFMTLLAAFKTLLFRYTQQDDIVVGVPIANRSQFQLEPLIGCFVNTLALRTILSGNPTFRELLARVRGMVLGAYAHHELPFDRLVAELQPERDLSRMPLFQIMFVLENTTVPTAKLGSLSISPIRIEDGGAQFDLTLIVYTKPEGMSCVFQYNTDLFDESTVARMLQHYHNLLDDIGANPDARLSELSLMTRQEREQLEQWNQTRSEYERDQCIHQLVELQAARQPNAVAVVHGEKQLNYDELNRRANQLAHYLRKHGVGLETRVGVLMERSVEWIVALLGILKAGGVYVPLDGDYPTERLQFMLEDAEIKLLLTESNQPDIVEEETTEVVSLDNGWEWLKNEDGENLENVTQAEDLAYVMYTSGSTGQPKGVGVPHRAINRLVSNSNYVKFHENDRVAQISNASFDAATFEIWGALLNGSRLVVLEKDTALSPTELRRQLVDQKISIMFLTTALFNQTALSRPEIFSSLNYMLFGGDAVDTRSVQRVLEQGKPRHLVNGYGPTEGTTFTASYEVQEVDRGAWTIPIGRPLSNTEIWVLDQQGQMALIGAVGELFIGGDGLARGYLGRPALTAEKFVPHPFSRKPGARLYKTGDLARYLSDGNIEFLGRLDQQVKVRGYRIELGEIEAALAQHKSVRNAVVLAREDMKGDNRLVAYVVGSERGDVTGQQLRSYLANKLPEYMIPSAFVILEELPLTANGKIDRRALPMPGLGRAYTGVNPSLTPPRTAVEALLARIWSAILEIDQVGIYDNFFELGGDSLSAISLVSQIRKVFDVELPFISLFEAPTISELASRLSRITDNELAVEKNAERLRWLVEHYEEEVEPILGRKAQHFADDIFVLHNQFEN